MRLLTDSWLGDVLVSLGWLFGAGLVVFSAWPYRVILGMTILQLATLFFYLTIGIFFTGGLALVVVVLMGWLWREEAQSFIEKRNTKNQWILVYGTLGCLAIFLILFNRVLPGQGLSLPLVILGSMGWAALIFRQDFFRQQFALLLLIQAAVILVALFLPHALLLKVSLLFLLGFIFLGRTLWRWTKSADGEITAPSLLKF